MRTAFPPCRHRREPRHRTVYHCRSPKVVGLRLVSAELCGQCPFPDHHFPGEGDESPRVAPEMPVEDLAALIAGPPRSWPAGWEDWPVTRAAHLLAADRFLAALPEYPAGDFAGRGIVIAGGGPRYFPSLYVTARAIRHVGCDLPIQVWYLGREDELPPERRRLLEPFGVECVDADAVRERRPCRILNGWELKVYAVLHSPFAEVLSLDADCYPVRDPGFLFDDAGYRATGAIFWPDSVSGTPLDWTAFGVEPSGRASVESGQFVVDKRRSWRPLALAWWYNDHSDWSYLHGYGDMHTFDVAWARCGAAFRRFTEAADWHVHSFRHVGPDGRLLFVHRCRDKFRCGEQGYLSPQSFAANHFLPELPLEAACFAWRDELADALRRPTRTDIPPASTGRDTVTEHFYKSIPGGFDFPDVYREAVAAAPPRAHFVEVGAWFGQSTAFLAVEALNSGKAIRIDVVDHWEGGYADAAHLAELRRYDVAAEFENNMRRGGVRDAINVVRGDSPRVAEGYADGTLDFVFIDASHDFHSVRWDLLAWLPKLKPGGLLAGHDWGFFEVTPAVLSILPAEEVRVRGNCWLWTKPAGAV
jgi:hypothetical protein